MMSNVDMYLREKKIMYATFKTLGNRRTDTDYVVLYLKLLSLVLLVFLTSFHIIEYIIQTEIVG